MTRPLVHFEIHGKDAQKPQDSYSSLFGWQIDPNNPMQYGMVARSRRAGGRRRRGITSSPIAPAVVIYIRVESLGDTLKKAASLGGEAVMQPMDVPGRPTIAQFRDPEGNLMGLIQP